MIWVSVMNTALLQTMTFGTRCGVSIDQFSASFSNAYWAGRMTPPSEHLQVQLEVFDSCVRPPPNIGLLSFISSPLWASNITGWSPVHQFRGLLRKAEPS